MKYISLTKIPDDYRRDLLAPHVETLTVAQETPPNLGGPQYLFAQQALLVGRLLGWLNRHQIPAIGPRYHTDVSYFSPLTNTYMLPILRDAFHHQTPDFFFASPQLNPIALQAGSILDRTKTILATFDLEGVRVARLAAIENGIGRFAKQLDVRRAKRFEKDNISCYDGIIAVSELDKSGYSGEYGFDQGRILVIENSVDTDYFAFQPKSPSNKKSVVFIANMAYPPNDDAGQRLLKKIMPIVREQIPDAVARIVGQGPSQLLIKMADQKLNFVTGQVEDIRPFLNDAAVSCIPLRAGSGTKYKVLEALSAGIPVVCSNVAAEGLKIEKNIHAMIAETDAEIASAIINILQEPDKYRKMAKSGRKLVEDYYSWEHNLTALAPWLEQIKQMPKRTQTPS